MSNTYNTDYQLPWIEKYRPKTIDDIISHQDIILSLNKFIDKKSLPHLLFYGPSGTGKTSTIKCCAKKLYDKYVEYMTMELNASNERGIDTVRTKIKNFVCNKNSIFLKPGSQDIFKLVILDEIDAMTVEAQGMLRQTIENHSNTTRFCLICNDIDKINPALQSRCAHYRFTPLKPDIMKKRLIQICSFEFIDFDKGAIDAIVKISKGDMRAAINSLQHINLTVSHKISEMDVYKISGHCTPNIQKKIFNKLVELSTDNSDFILCINYITDLICKKNITIFNLLEILKDSILASSFSDDQKIYLIDNLARNEIYDSVCVHPKNIIMIIVSLFVDL